MGNKNSPNKKETFILSYTNGDKYEGEVINGVREGHGTYFYHNGDKYEGWWQNNKKHGMGTLYYKDGNLYVGQWKNSEKEGVGTLYFRNGEKYYGEFRGGKKNGKGFLISADTNKYIGYFKDNKKNGIGVIYFNKGKKAREEWTNGILISSKLISEGNSEVEKNLIKNQELTIYNNQYLDVSFDNYIEDQIKFHQNQNTSLAYGGNKYKSKFFTLEVAKYFKARIPNNYFDAMQIVTMTSDLIYDNPHVTEWAEDEVCTWLDKLGLEKYNDKFRENQIDGYKFLKLNVNDMQQSLTINDKKEIKLLMKSLDFLRIFVKLKLDYQEYLDYEKQKGENEGTQNAYPNFYHHSNSMTNFQFGVSLLRERMDKGSAINLLQEKEEKREIISNSNTKTNAHTERKFSEGAIPNPNHENIATIIGFEKIKEEEKEEGGVIENQEYVLTKMAISKIIFNY